MPSTAAWVDTGFLVALFDQRDPHHASAKAFLKAAGDLQLHSIWPIVTEASYLLDAPGRDCLLQWLAQGPITFHELSTSDLEAIRATLKKYRSLAPDFADAVLVTFATELAITKIVTVDVRDFSVYRLKNGRAFERLWL